MMGQEVKQGDRGYFSCVDERQQWLGISGSIRDEELIWVLL